MKVPVVVRTSIVLILMVAMAVATPTNQPPARAAGSWYVAPGGSDDNSCQNSGEPCATINGAIAKAAPSDTIYIAEGVYISSVIDAVVSLNKDVNLSGGWASDFNSRDGLSVIDAQYERRGMIIAHDVTTLIERIEITHGVGQSSGGGGGIMIGDNATVSITDSIIQESQSYGGIFAWYADLTLVRSTVRHSIDQGITNYLGTLRIVSSAIVGNTYGIVSNGNLFIDNSTVSGNTHGGIAMDCSGSIDISNSTITENHDFGLRTYWCNSATMQNTILAGNADNTHPDCSGPVLSDGYNIVGDTTGCGFGSTPNDLTNIDAKLVILQDNGGPTQTHALLDGSPAIDAGNPNGCTDHQDNPLISDQRGYPRYGSCDIGSFEMQPRITMPNPVYLPILSSTCSSTLHFDDFSDLSSGWPISDDEVAQFGYLDGEYRILVKTHSALAGARPDFQASDYSAFVDVRNATGVAGSYGMIFGLADDWSQFYIFDINRDGIFEIWRVDLGERRLLAMGFSRIIHTGTATNQLKIVRKGSQIQAYVNGQLLKIIEDENYTGLRSLGLVNITSLTQSNVDARFDNFTVYPISCAASSSLLGQESGMNAAKFIAAGLPKGWQIQLNQSVIP